MTIVVNGSNTPTAGGVGYGDGTNLAFTGAGTSGQVLVSAGSSAPAFGSVGVSAISATGTPSSSTYLRGDGTWNTPPAGAMVVLSSGTVSGSPTTLDFETGMTDSTYAYIQIVLLGLTNSTSGNLTIRFKQSGAYVTSANYFYQNMTASGASVSGNATGSAAGSVVDLSVGTGGTSASFVLMNRFSTTAGAPFIVTNAGAGAAAANGLVNHKSYLNVGADIEGVRFYLSGGSGGTVFSGGSYVMYGLKAA